MPYLRILGRLPGQDIDMPNLQFSSEILDDILFRAGEKTDGTSDYEAQALIYLNRAYRTIYMGGQEFSPEFHEKWGWAEQVTSHNGIINAVIKTGTVTVTRGSTSITFSSAPTISVASHKFRVDDDEDMYEIDTHTAASTAATLQLAYTGTTGSGKNFRLMQFRHALMSSVVKVSSPIHFYQDGGRECDHVSMEDIRRFYVSGKDLSGVPDMFSYDEKDNLIHFNRYGSDTENEKMVYELSARERPADLTNSITQEPIVPLQWRHVLSDLALYFVYLDKDDSRAQIVFNQAKAILIAMKVENRAFLEQSGEPGHIFPRGRPNVRRVKTSSGKLIGYFR